MNEDKIINKLLEHDEELRKIRENMLTREDGRKLFDILEDMATRVKRIDEDRVLTHQWVKRIEDKVESHDKMIDKIKMQLKIV
ncbi:MAG: hypothetical protein UU95_C0018G0001 [Parcubacteria group bacterium GW2011_GWC2_42_12]|uniref:Uncharacterized protein n=1 Tax=Candidatus Falkowbacteria bacterium RIFCSPHIGHO2_02_FULL_42_9 TaxID=1797986 RepID=A0A1F5S7S7_9BACT|nr:MAG: hypothetical protein UU95_C0018G0001 [Parcubacteria group bacterium GW2011_GWC2_42_12]OGF22717.1 MAG: hypothetical protein A3D45_02035 [Candidatus Falkowbacteria bacterium RIFCSPHIGHO2_02_FULL_42_9]